MPQLVLESHKHIYIQTHVCAPKFRQSQFLFTSVPMPQASSLNFFLWFAAHVRCPLDTNYINKGTTKDALRFAPHTRFVFGSRGSSQHKLFQFSPFYRKLRTIQYLAFLLSLVLCPVVCLFSA